MLAPWTLLSRIFRFCHNITAMTNDKWLALRLKSPATGLIIQPLIQADNKENTKGLHDLPFVSPTQSVENISFSWRHHEIVAKRWHCGISVKYHGCHKANSEFHNSMIQCRSLYSRKKTTLCHYTSNLYYNFPIDIPLYRVIVDCVISTVCYTTGVLALNKLSRNQTLEFCGGFVNKLYNYTILWC